MPLFSINNKVRLVCIFQTLNNSSPFCWTFLKSFFGEGSTWDFTITYSEMIKGEMYTSSGGLSAEDFLYFELPRLDFLKFQHYFRSFSDKKMDVWWGGGGGGEGPFSLGPT